MHEINITEIIKEDPSERLLFEIERNVKAIPSHNTRALKKFSLIEVTTKFIYYKCIQNNQTRRCAISWQNHLANNVLHKSFLN